MGFRLGSRQGRAVLVVDDGLVDLEAASDGAFGPDILAALARHRELHAVADATAGREPDHPLDPAELDACVPRPTKVFGVGLNYPAHAAESGSEMPEVPLIFAKFPNCLTGPSAEVVVPEGAAVDWEAELVVVIGDHCRAVPEAGAWDVVAGVCAGNDVSDRVAQFASSPPHFDMGKSWDGFGPVGPAVVSTDLLGDPDDIGLTCDVNGERMQDDRTSSMFHSVPALVAHLSRFCTLEPGDLVFTGTPDCVGAGRGQFQSPGDEVVVSVEGVGELTNRFVPP